MPQRWFVDTSFVIALVSARDNFHDIAQQLSARIEHESIELTTSDAIVLEIGAALSKIAYRAVAIELIDSLRSDTRIEILTIDRDLLDRAFALFKSHADKEWSLTDCTSFELMRSRSISEALTADSHFEQAGFAALMKRH